ncbi:MAG: class I SAM-dependent methyltransferase [Candidatus Binataceae bacterium]
MTRKKIDRPGVRGGYDLWADSYDRTANPLIALDRRVTLDILRPATGERVLDAGCGTGEYLRRLRRAGTRPVGVDFSWGMLSVARRRNPAIPLAQADLNDRLPVQDRAFDGVLCALVGEHLTQPALTFREAYASLDVGGRFVFSVFHPELAAAGIEANFERSGVEYRLGAYRYSVDDYLNMVGDAGFDRIAWREFAGDDRVVDEVPWASKYLGRPLLLVIEAHRLH